MASLAFVVSAGTVREAPAPTPTYQRASVGGLVSKTSLPGSTPGAGAKPMTTADAWAGRTLGPFPSDPPTPTPLPTLSTPTVAQARAWAMQTLGPKEYHCLDLVITYESKWDPLAVNKRSGAMGLPQAVPGSKMASAGADWRTNPETQLRWAIWYGQTKYGSLCNAAMFELGWWDRHGGWHPGRGWW